MDRDQVAADIKKTKSKARDRLSALMVKSITTPGIYHDGGGLYLQVSRLESRSKSWFLRYTIEGKVRDMGLGSLTEWSLSEIRERAKKYRRMLDDKLDPIEVRNSERLLQKAEVAEKAKLQASQKTFAECAYECHKSLKSSWKNSKHGDQWINTLTTYAFPILGKNLIAEVDKHSIKNVMLPIWLSKKDTADRLLQRIRTVMDWAVAHEYHPGYKPSLWKDLTTILPQRPDQQRKHFSSCPYADVGPLVKQLQATGVTQIVKLCFEFMILTAARSGEARGALKSEIDFDKKIWRIDGSRMKAGITHTVPLSDRAEAILREAFSIEPDSVFVFPSTRKKTALSDQAFTKVVLRENLKVAYTAHGFRSSFRTWAGKLTNYDRIVCELALAHDLKTDVESAYDRNDYEEKRRHLMQDWASYLKAEGNANRRSSNAVS
ncbi:XerC Integrase [Comamonadaceae bacterium]